MKCNKLTGNRNFISSDFDHWCS